MPETSTVSTNWDRTHTAIRESVSPASRAYRFLNRARKAGAPRLSWVLTSHMTFSPKARERFKSFRATVMRRFPASSHSTAQKLTPFWAQRFKKRSGKAPETSRRTLPRRKLMIFCITHPLGR